MGSVGTDGRARIRMVDEEGHELPAGGVGSVEAKGPTSFGLFSCSKATNELNFITQKFARAVIGSNNIDSCNRT